MRNSQINRLPVRIIFKQLAANYFLAAPVLTYFAATSFPFAASNRGLFMTMAFASCLVSLAVVIIGNSAAMRPISHFAARKRLGRADATTVDRAVRTAYRFPAIHGWIVMACWAVVSEQQSGMALQLQTLVAQFKVDAAKEVAA